MEKKKVYISGPISGHDLEERRREFKRTAEFLEEMGYIPVNPMENGLPADATTHQHMKRDFHLLIECDAIYMLRRWTHSAGCKVEFDVATACGMKVIFEDAVNALTFIGFE